MDDEVVDCPARLEPEFASFEFDDAAMAEASARWAESYAEDELELQ